MSIFQERHDVESEKNGPLKLVRNLWEWRLISQDGAEQSGPYLTAMWNKVLRNRVMQSRERKHVLVLGVGLGNVMKLIARRDPRAHVVAVDWDEHVLNIAKTHFRKQYPDDTHFIHGDAATVTPQLNGRFDLITIDLFNGFKVLEINADPEFQKHCFEKLTPNGVIAVNLFDQPQMLEGWRKLGKEVALVRHEANIVGLFEKSIKE